MATLLSMEALEADRRFVARQLAETDDNPWGTVRLMWRNRLSEIDETIAQQALAHSNYASVAVIFDGEPVVGSRDIRLDFATNALDSYQKIVALTAAANQASEGLPLRGAPPGANQSRLYIRDLVRGSMGFILEEVAPDQTEMVATNLKDAVENTTELLLRLSRGSEEEFETTLVNTQSRVVAAVQKFAKILRDAQASARIFGDRQKIALSINEVGRLSDRLSEIEVTEKDEMINGVLRGILPDSRKFELKPVGENSRTITGEISEDVFLKYTANIEFKERFLLQSVHARIKVIHTTRKGRQIRERRILEAMDESKEKNA